MIKLFSGCGYGHGGYGDSYGGYGYGYGGDGYGGYGYGYGYGGDGYGGDGCYGYGGYGYGYGGYGHGYGGYGYGYGGDGYGHGAEIYLEEACAFGAYHYTRKDGDKYILRNGRDVKVGECLKENDIKICERGLHASFSPVDAANYKPDNSVLTKVLMWGRIMVSRNKLVATNRKLIEEMEEGCD